MLELSQRLQRALGERYRVERELGRGSSATVFLAADCRHHRCVAIKVLDPQIAAAIGPERFVREIDTVAGLTHPNILPLHDSGVADGLLFYVMPYIEGETLRRRLEREKQLPLEDALRIAREVADALDYAHGHGVVHRDIKPENILLEAGHAVVSDFGIARALVAAGGDKLTASGVVMGTPAYLSPEQAAGSRSLDGRSDLYSLACVLFEMLAGQPPFTGPAAESIAFQHLNASPPRLITMRPAVPAALDRAIARALAKTPADRYVSATEFTVALSAEDEPAPKPGRRVGRWLVAGATGVFLAVAGVAVLREWGPFDDRASARARKDWILVAEFEGPPGDSTLATVARSLVSAALDQSRIVATVPQGQIRQALLAAGKPTSAHVDAELARELAYRRSVRAVLEGTIGRIGNGYSIVLRVVDADTPQVLVATRATARDENALIPALGQAAKQLRAGLGENRAALRATRSMGLVATPSFEALRLYVRGLDIIHARAANREALSCYRAAVALDPDFATAWLAMAFPYANLQYPDSERTCIEEALRRPDRLTLDQRQQIQILLADLDGDPSGAVAALDRLLAVDPGNVRALTSSNDYLWKVGRFEEALARTRRAMALSPLGAVDAQRVNEVAGLLSLGRFDEARTANLANHTIWRDWQSFTIEAAAGDWARAESVATAHLGPQSMDVDVPGRSQMALGWARFARGAVADADAALRCAEEIAWAASDRFRVEYVRRERVVHGVIAGAAGSLPPDTWAHDTTTTMLLTRGLWAAAAGDVVLARRLLDGARRRPPSELAFNGAASAVLEAQIEARAGRPDHAVRLLRPIAVERVERGGDDGGVGLTYVRWVLADAFEQLGQPDSASACLERVFSIPFSADDLKPWVHWRLALLHANLGHVTAATRHLGAAERTWNRPDPAVRRMLDEARTAVHVARGPARPSV